MKTKLVVLVLLMALLPTAIVAHCIIKNPEKKVIWEECVDLESRMNSPFTIDPEEESLVLEPWMTSPFIIDTVEEPLVLESWMTSPFTTYKEEKPLFIPR